MTWRLSKFFCYKLLLKMFWVWTETWTGLSWARLKQEVLKKFQTFLNLQHVHKCSQKFRKKLALKQKVRFLLLSTQFFGCYLRPRPKPSAIIKMFRNKLNTMGNSRSWESKLIHPSPPKLKGKLLLSFETKVTFTHKNTIT